jgi:hypothetical protein
MCVVIKGKDSIANYLSREYSIQNKAAAAAATSSIVLWR